MSVLKMINYDGTLSINCIL